VVRLHCNTTLAERLAVDIRAPQGHCTGDSQVCRDNTRAGILVV